MCWETPESSWRERDEFHLRPVEHSPGNGCPLPRGPRPDLHTMMPSARWGSSESLAVVLTPPQPGDKDCCTAGLWAVKQQGKTLCTLPCRAMAKAGMPSSDLTLVPADAVLPLSHSHLWAPLFPHLTCDSLPLVPPSSSSKAQTPAHQHICLPSPHRPSFSSPPLPTTFSSTHFPSTSWGTAADGFFLPLDHTL